jgi:hypothetical protein
VPKNVKKFLKICVVPLVVFPIAYLALEWTTRKALKLADKADPYIFGEDETTTRRPQ